MIPCKRRGGRESWRKPSVAEAVAVAECIYGSVTYLVNLANNGFGLSLTISWVGFGVDPWLIQSRASIYGMSEKSRRLTRLGTVCQKYFHRNQVRG
jgi:hypothetical protein